MRARGMSVSSSSCDPRRASIRLLLDIADGRALASLSPVPPPKPEGHGEGPHLAAHLSEINSADCYALLPVFRCDGAQPSEIAVGAVSCEPHWMLLGDDDFGRLAPGLATELHDG
jgi:hypothetical protein